MRKRSFNSSAAMSLILLLLFMFVFHVDDAEAQYVPRTDDLPGDTTGETILKGALIGFAVIAVIVIVSKVSKSSDGETEKSDSTATSMFFKEADYYSKNDISRYSIREEREVNRVNINRSIEPICVLRRDECLLGLRFLF